MSIKNNTTELQEVLEVLANKAANNGVTLPELTNEGSASDLLSGKQLIDGDGKVVTGTIPTKTSSNLTASGATVTVPSGYYASQATKSVSTATQATPSVSVDANGKITATATQTAGYVASGTKTGTKQLTVKAATTITPSATSQTAVESGIYTTGKITVAAVPTQTKTVTPKATTQNVTPDSGKFLSKVTVNGDSNLVAENIKSGVSIFGISGTASSGIDTSDATATNAEIFEGKTAYVNNTKVTGTFTINNELSEQDQLLTELESLLATKASTQETWVLTLTDGTTVEKVVSLI